MTFEDILTIIIVLIIVGALSIVVAIVPFICEKREEKVGPNNRCVKSIISSFRILTNSSLSYVEIRDIFDNSSCFTRLREGCKPVLNRGLENNLLVIKEELLNCEKVGPEIKEKTCSNY